ncbi:HPP family protein [Paraburkholderia sp. SIMBA_054]|jgi:CBS-domain-containing membrane protein|uniref:CBS domain-containing protein n=1 Tax=Paraburkholderia sp. SIMBA_054 TaxID=3085795 RepID=UPI0039783038
MSTNLETIRRWIRVAFRKRRRGRRRELPQDLPNGSRLSELTNSWRDQASRDEWSRISCAKVMRAPFVILHDAPIGAALELLERNGLCALLVVDGNQDLQGLVTREDLMAGCDDCPEAGIDPRCVGDVMLAEVDVVGETDTLGTAFSLLMNERSPCLPVLDWRGHVVGILAESDILEVSGHLAGTHCGVAPHASGR